MLNRNIDLYTKEQIELIKTELKEFLYFFGYVKTTHHPDNNTPFFEYEDDGPEELYYGFRKHNAEVLAKLGTN